MNKLYEKIEYYAGAAPENKSFTYRIGESYRSIDYISLKNYIDSLAAYLSAYQGQTIAIIGNNKLEYAISLLAILCKVGNAFLINKELNKEDILKVFEKISTKDLDGGVDKKDTLVSSDRGPALIILDEDMDLDFPDYDVLHFSDISRLMNEGTKEDEAKAGDQEKEEESEAGVQDKEAEAQAANNEVFDKGKEIGNLILHTSGTTGEPKLVKIDQDRYYGGLSELNRKWEAKSDHADLLIIPLYHIYALISLFHCIYGGKMTILEWDYKRLSQVLVETKPHIFMGVPLMYQRIQNVICRKAGIRIKVGIFFSRIFLKLGIDLRKKLFREIHEYFGGNYIFGVSAGSLLPNNLSRFYSDVGLPIYNVYGMTETSGPIAINYRNHNPKGSVGEILDINEIRIKNSDENGIGQVCVSGPNIFEGYLGEGKACNFDGEYFNTGDIGYVKDNYLYVLGRNDGILIGANGKNISSEELNKKIMANRRVHDCKILMENNRLIAIINTDLSFEELGRYIDKINQKLPRYKRIFKYRIEKEESDKLGYK
ncbi:MAG: AMP-binding protein [Eubacterium sp.]|nr:AMP-binding protein [Eubacterium sp.]